MNRRGLGIAGIVALSGLALLAPHARSARADAGAGASAAAPAPAVVPAGPSAEGRTLSLFNGKDLTGFKQFLGDPNADPAQTWSVVDGAIRCSGQPPGYIRTEQSFKNYFLVVEWRWPANPTNSGVLLHMQGADQVWPKSVEAQLMSGEAGDFWLIDGATAQVEEARRNPGHGGNVKGMAKAEHKPGEWNRYEITCIDGHVVLVINGKLVNVGRNCTPNEGFICLQSEGSPIEFRKVELTPIP